MNWASLQIGKQAAPISVRLPDQANAPDIYHPIISDCIVTQPAGSGVTHADGVLAIQVGRLPGAVNAPGKVRNASVRGNCVYNVGVDAGGANKPKFIRGVVLTDCVGGQIVANTAYDVEGPIVFGEAGTGDQILIQSNSFIKVLQGIVYRFPASGTSQWSSVVAQNNYVSLMNKSGAKGISITGGLNFNAKKVVVEGNVVRMFETSTLTDILGLEFTYADDVAVKSNIIDVPPLSNPLVFGTATTVAQCINNRTAAGQVLQAFAALLAAKINANTNLWTDLGKAVVYRIITTLPGAELTLPVIDVPAANNPSKAPPGYRFALQNASVVNSLKLKNSNGLVIAEIPAGVQLTLTASDPGWEIKFWVERDTYEQMTVAASESAYVGLYGGEAVDVNVTGPSATLFLPQVFEGWSVLLNNTGSYAITVKDFNGGTVTTLANPRAMVAVAGAPGWIAKLFATA